MAGDELDNAQLNDYFSDGPLTEFFRKPDTVWTPRVLAASCGGRPARVDLGVDVYLHPDSAEPRDLMLQAAIRERLDQIAAKRRDQVYVRVFDLTAFLSGSVKDPCYQDRGEPGGHRNQSDG